MAVPTEVRVEVTGLALCYLKPGEPFWNVIFVCDSVHPLSLSQGGAHLTDLRQPNQDLTFRFICDDFGNSPPPPSRRNFDTLLNISDPGYAHGIAANGKSNLIEERRRRLPTDLVSMQVPHAAMTVSDFGDCFIMQTNPLPQPPKLIRGRGKKVTLAFNVSSNFSVEARDVVTGAVTYSRAFDINTTTSPIVLSLVNDCGGICTHNDFVDLYEFVVHRIGNDEVRFVTWSPSAVSKEVAGLLQKIDKSQLMVESVPHFEKLLAMVPSPTFGNCDPVSSEPPPGP